MANSSRKTAARVAAEKERKAVKADDASTLLAVESVDTTLQGIQSTLTTIDADTGRIGVGLLDGVEAAAGRISGLSVVNKFGYSASIGTSFAPLTLANAYRMPQPASATALRIAAGNTNDTAAGSGAREVTFQGLDETGALVEEAVATAGTSASSATTATFIRLFRGWVSSSGTYADGSSTFSHAAAITIENSGGGTTWGSIAAQQGQTQIACYTIPLGKTGFISSAQFDVNSTKDVDFKLMQRRSALDAAAPYQAWRLVSQQAQVAGSVPFNPDIPLGPYPALTDLVFFAKVTSGTGIASVDFEILLEDE